MTEQAARRSVAERAGLWWTISAVVLVVLGYFLWLLIEPGGGFRAMVFSDIVGDLAAGAAAGACLRAARRRVGTARVGWALIGVGMLCTGTGDTVWTWYDLVLRTEVPTVSIADVAYLSQLPLTLAGLLVLLSSSHTGTVLRTLLDGLIIGSSFLYLSWAAILGTALSKAGLEPLERFVTLAYPLGDVATASMVFVVLSAVDRRARGPLIWLGGGLLALAFADSGYAYLLTLNDEYTSGDLIDTAWFAAFVLVCAAGLRSTGRPSAAATDGDPWRRVGLPYVPLTIALVTSVVVEVRTGSVGPVLYLTGTVMVVLVVVRQLVTLRENLGLTRRLEQTVEDLRRSEEQLRHLAFHDPLTGLANRALFHDRVEHAIARQERHGAAVAVLYIDLDGFKGINDSLGHAAGDALLTTVAWRLRGCARPSDTVARLGGDEFAVLVEQLGNPAIAVELAERIVDVLAEPVELDGRQARVGASVGVTLREAAVGNVSEILREADVAMYAAKLQGKGRCVVFEPEMRSAMAGAA